METVAVKRLSESRAHARVSTLGASVRTGLEPSPKYTGMLWYDETTYSVPVLRIWSGSSNVWNNLTSTAIEKIEEYDSDPTLSVPFDIVVPNGSLSLNGVQAQLGYLQAPPYITGRFYDGLPQGDGKTGSALTIIVNTLYGFPFYVSHPHTWTRIAIEVVVGTFGGLFKLGIYNMGSDGNPNSLILETDNLDAIAGTDRGEDITFVSKPGWYVTALLSDSTPDLTTKEGTFRQLGIDRPDRNPASFFKKGSVTFGSLPDPFGSIDTYARNNNPLAIRLKA